MKREYFWGVGLRCSSVLLTKETKIFFSSDRRFCSVTSTFVSSDQQKREDQPLSSLIVNTQHLGVGLYFADEVTNSSLVGLVQLHLSKGFTSSSYPKILTISTKLEFYLAIEKFSSLIMSSK